MMTQEEFQRIKRFIKNKYGIDLNRKKEIVVGRLDNYVREGGWFSYHDYMNAVESDITGELEKKLVNLLTTNHTFFMRESEHFDFLKQVVLPYLKEKEKNRRDLCIWSAASSTGEEPYTLAMTVKEFLGLEQGTWDTKILATDISTKVLHQAVQGRYSLEQMEAVPDNWKRRYFRKSRDGMFLEATPALKNEVIFRQFNLMDPFPFKRKMHVVFLRNVMIYFDDKTKQELIQKIYDVMEPGGYLFIGQTETLDRQKTDFEMIRPSVFRKREGSR